MPRQIDINECTNCGSCISSCPVDAISKDDNNMPKIDVNECVDCATCWRICPSGCVNGGPDKYLDLRTR